MKINFDENEVNMLKEVMEIIKNRFLDDIYNEDFLKIFPSVNEKILSIYDKNEVDKKIKIDFELHEIMLMDKILEAMKFILIDDGYDEDSVRTLQAIDIKFVRAFFDELENM